MSSKIDENLVLFNNKCAKLNLPPENYPDPQYLRKIFRQNLSFFELFIQKVDTKYAIEKIRKNILVAHMTNSVKEKNVIQQTHLVPAEFTKYVKYMNLKEKIKGLKERQHFQKHEENIKVETTQTNDIKIIKLKENTRLTKIKTDLLQAKSININKKIEEELELQKKIKDVTPAKFSSSDNIDDFYRNILKCIDTLREYSTESNNVDNNSTKDKFWKKVESFLKKVPNNIIFQIAMKQINSKIEDSILSTISSTSDEQQAKISEKLLPYLYEQKIILGIEYLAQKKRLENSKERCAEHIQAFENEVESLMNSSIDFSFQLEEDDIVSEFVSELIAKVNLEGKIQFYTNNISSMKQQVEANTCIYEYEQLVNDTRSIYSFIDEKITAVQEHVSQVHQINEKINFSKIVINRMIQTMKLQKAQQHNRSLLNQTLNNTVIAVNKETEVSLPKHEYEIQQFLSIPINSFDNAMATDKYWGLSDEKVVSNMIQIEGKFTNPHHFLNHLDKRIKFRNKIKPLYTEIQSQIDQKDTKDVNYDELQKQRDENCEEISSTFDEISRLNVSIKSNLKNINRLYSFALENPLKKFVPKSKKFDGKSYESYEKEYMLYYKMVKK
ncbi:hypothetical protein ACKWTF_009194 [Chironomus riparius]